MDIIRWRYAKISVFVFSIVLTLSACASQDSETNSTSTAEPVGGAVEEAPDDENTVNPTQEDSPSPALAQTTGTYTTYDAEQVSTSNADQIFLFFHAPWCPSCVALENDILANEESIPEGVEIYKVDYDSETELKARYGVTRQHSVLEIDSDGNILSEVTHPATLGEITESL
jgi:thiol-disulfide isomerase/thioredoxin